MLQTVAFFMMHQEPVFFKSEHGYGIVSVSSPGPAPQNPSSSHEKTPYRSVYAQGIESILRTRGYMTARRPQKRRYGVPVKMYGDRKQFYCNTVQSRSHGAKIING